MLVLSDLSSFLVSVRGALLKSLKATGRDMVAGDPLDGAVLGKTDALYG